MLEGLDAIALDLPGFGVAQEPPAAWSTAEYASFVNPVLDDMAGGPVVVLGHSFGARVAVHLAAGAAPAGAAPAGTAPAGAAPAGTAPAGTAPAGTAPAGAAPAGAAPKAAAPTGGVVAPRGRAASPLSSSRARPWPRCRASGRPGPRRYTGSGGLYTASGCFPAARWRGCAANTVLTTTVGPAT